MKKIIASCGMEIKKSEGYVCPYFCRKDEWKKEKGNYGCCQVNVQCDTNVCLFAPKQYL